MRNWISDKFGRNRVRTRASNTVPSTTPAPTAPIVYASSTSDGVQYWYRNTGYSTVTFSNRLHFAGRQYEYTWWDESTPTYPKHLRLPDGA